MDEKKKVIPMINAATEILCHRLSQLAPGEVVSYEELSRCIAGNVRGAQRHYLRGARRKAQNDHGVVTEAVARVGLRRCSGTDFIGIASRGVKSVNRASRRALKKTLLMPQGEYEELGNADRIALNTKRSQLGAVNYCTSQKSSNRLEAAVTAQNGRLPDGRVLKELSQGDGK